MDDVEKRIVSRDCPVCGGAKSQAAALPYGTEEWPMVACGGPRVARGPIAVWRASTPRRPPGQAPPTVLAQN